MEIWKFPEKISNVAPWEKKSLKISCDVNFIVCESPKLYDSYHFTQSLANEEDRGLESYPQLLELLLTNNNSKASCYHK